MVEVKPRCASVDLLLTTYPLSTTKNVGDMLIADSAIRLIRSRVPAYNPIVVFRGDSLDVYPPETVRTLVAPGYSVREGSYPKLYGLYNNLNDMHNVGAFFPIGCALQDPRAANVVYESYEYSEESLRSLREIDAISGGFRCRDQKIVEMLTSKGIRASYIGDLALYDETVLMKLYSPPKNIKSVVFTVQHKARYRAQSFEVLKLIGELFPAANLYVAHHSTITDESRIVSDFAVKLGFTEIDLSGDVENLAFYDDIDLHVGYRLHGHISFLRRRKPSFLITEDARSFGIISTPGMNVGGLSALNSDGVTVNQSLVDELSALLNAEIKSNFSGFYSIFKFIDKTYINSVSPCFDRIAEGLGRERRFGAAKYVLNNFFIVRNTLGEMWFSRQGLKARLVSKLRKFKSI